MTQRKQGTIVYFAFISEFKSSLISFNENCCFVLGSCKNYWVHWEMQNNIRIVVRSSKMSHWVKLDCEDSRQRYDSYRMGKRLLLGGFEIGRERRTHIEDHPLNERITTQLHDIALNEKRLNWRKIPSTLSYRTGYKSHTWIR